MPLPNKPLHLTIPPQGHRSIIETRARAAGSQVNGKALGGQDPWPLQSCQWTSSFSTEEVTMVTTMLWRDKHEMCSRSGSRRCGSVRN